MSLKLSPAQQRAVLRALPPGKKAECAKVCAMCHMRGEGIKDILKKVASVIGPVAKQVGPTVLKEFILPMLKKKYGIAASGSGRRPAGNGLQVPGGALKLAGEGKKRKTTRRRKTA